MNEGPAFPHQPLVFDDGNVIRFRKNRIVAFLLETSRFTLNDLALMHFSGEEWVQFSELIGYSLAGWGNLSYVSDEQYDSAARQKVWANI